jgi:copper chaperone CopZ
MTARSAFHLDCTPIIPECEFQCPRCVQEIEAVVGRMPGVTRVYLDSAGETAKMIVEHDPSQTTVQRLLETFAGLPSFYTGRFVPELLRT